MTTFPASPADNSAREASKSRSRAFVLFALALLVAGALAGWWWEKHRAAAPASGDDAALTGALADAGIDGHERAAIEGLVRAYILDHPEIIPEAVDKLRQREAQAQIAPMRGALETPFPGAVLGNPAGKLTLVEFTDFACTFCRRSVGDLDALIAANPDLRVVVRELPIIAPASLPAARMALAAAAQGKYPAYHKAMFAGAAPDAASIDAAGTAAGLDLSAARTFAATPQAQAELSHNLDMARQLGIEGTPAWIVGERLLRGAVGREALQQAIEAARKG
ncbi:DsbA family protein [Novosphingobium lentum]|uniref:DsbA family protein n=1 Tax=Novosphingobium lentum TaxID=145287 RepID=UPI000A065550|nr:DsbA family protein [Novosphingobium lentum]